VARGPERLFPGATGTLQPQPVGSRRAKVAVVMGALGRTTRPRAGNLGADVALTRRVCCCPGAAAPGRPWDAAAAAARPGGSMRANAEGVTWARSCARHASGLAKWWRSWHRLSGCPAGPGPGVAVPGRPGDAAAAAARPGGGLRAKAAGVTGALVRTTRPRAGDVVALGAMVCRLHCWAGARRGGPRAPRRGCSRGGAAGRRLASQSRGGSRCCDRAHDAPAGRWTW
jgi:hypothetical protein